MIVWVDAHLSPAIARWMTENLSVQAFAVRDLGLRSAKDRLIFQAAREAGAVILTKDSDFLELLAMYGAPPKLVWLTCGNTSNDHLQLILRSAWSTARSRLEAGEDLVEIADAFS